MYWLNVISHHITKTIRHHAGLQMATMIILIACFSLITGIATVSENLNRILVLWGESLEISVYLSDEISPDETQKIETYLKQNDKIDKLKFLTKENALENFRQQMVSYAPDILNDPEILKIIPKSFQFSINSKVASEDHLSVTQNIAASLKNFIGVEEVSFGQDWVKNYAHVVKGASAVGGLFSIIVLLAVIFIVSNAIRTSIHQRRYEVEVLELIGATPRYIRQPFLWEGGLIGGFSSLIGICLSYGLFLVIQENLKSQLAFLQLSSHIQFISWIKICFLFVFSIVLGVFASYFCLKSINDGWSASKLSNQTFNQRTSKR